MPSINLAPGAQQFIAARRGRRRLYLISIFILIIAGVVWAAVALYSGQLTRQAQAYNEQLRAIQTEIARLSDPAERVRRFEARLSVVGTLLDRHISWEPVFQSIERLLPATVTLTGITVTADRGEMILEGTTSDVDQVSQTLASFLAEDDQTVFSDGELLEVSRKTTRTEDEEIIEYEFQLRLTFSSSSLRRGGI
jgi:Tfp pilus assembly protein PilN